jgi:glycosyltransferase involved in cell wall biosynthesis
MTAHGLVFREVAALARTRVDRPGPLRQLTSGARGMIDSFYERQVLARIGNLVSISPYVDQAIQTLAEQFPAQAFRGRIFHIDNPVEDRFFSIGEPANKPTILYVGRVIPRKGLLELLRSFALVNAEFPAARLRIAGETVAAPEYADACRQFVADHHLEKAVAFLGSLTMDQVIEEYQNCGLVALPSLQETSPVAVAEAMAAGKAVVTNQACGMPYLVEDGHSGILLEYGDTEAWADALRRLLADPALRSSMGSRGRVIAEQRFRPSVVAAATRAAYYEIVGGSI